VAVLAASPTIRSPCWFILRLALSSARSLSRSLSEASRRWRATSRLIPITRSRTVAGDHRRFINQRDDAARRRRRSRNGRRSRRVNRAADTTVQRRCRRRRSGQVATSDGAILERHPGTQRWQAVPDFGDAVRVAIGQYAAAGSRSDGRRYQRRRRWEHRGAQISPCAAARFRNPWVAITRLRSAAIEARSRWIWCITWELSSNIML